jgi:hypothetical protein
MNHVLTAVLFVCGGAAGCAAVMTPADGSDYDGDGKVTFHDTERAPRSSLESGSELSDVDEALDRHMDRQRDDYRERVREGRAFDY